MVNGTGNPFGPFQLAEGIGYDELTERCEKLAEKFGKDVFKPTDMLKEGGPEG
ncbi:MAG: hypothetical protein ABEJ72_05010 [Candidatus Aenigmatarchaeota archaeon]